MEKTRRYDLDWLRVMVFGLLIFYHVGMFFVPWGWHIKNNETYEWLKIPMAFVNQWRLPILFVISGMGTAYALSFRSAGQFMKERFIRLYIPLAFGMLFIVSPQVYIERVYEGSYTGSFTRWFLDGQFFAGGAYPQGNITWNHLWFLPYLLIFSLILTPVFVRVRRNPEGTLLSWVMKRMKMNPWFLLWFVVPLYLYESLLEPFFNVTHNLVWDWFNLISSMTLFFYGFLLISIKDVFWVAVDSIWKKTLVLGLLTFSLLLIVWLNFEDNVWVHFTEALLKVINLWAWILTLFGFASNYLNSKSRILNYANKAVYPFYILHQTITVLIGFYLYDLDWSLATKFSLMVFGTFVGSWIIYEFMIRRVRFLQPLFGLK